MKSAAKHSNPKPKLEIANPDYGAKNWGKLTLEIIRKLLSAKGKLLF